MTKQYFFDNAGLCDGRDVTLTLGGCGRCQTSTQWNGAYSTSCLETITFSIPTVASQNIVVYYRYYLVQTSDIGSNWEGWQNGTVTILAGQLSGSNTLVCSTDSYEDYGSGGWAYESSEITSYELKDQPVIPDVCVGGGVGCDLAITSGQTTNPELRGGNDGSITVYLSGATGSTLSYFLNGILQTSTGSTTGYTFTGLVAGTYTVLAQEGDDCNAQQTYAIQDGEFRTGDFIVNQPSELVAADNPIILQLQTAINSITGAFSESKISITGDIDDGDKITFNFVFPQIYTATFTAREFPDRDTFFLASQLSNEMGVPVGTNTEGEITVSLAEAISKDRIINQLYFLRVDGNDIYFKAKERNTNLDLTILNVIPTGNLTITTITNGLSRYDGQITANYSLYTEIFVNTTAQFGETVGVETFNRVGDEIELPFASNNIHRFDLSEVLKNYVSTPKIDFSITGFTTIAPQMAAYYCNYGEKYPLIANSNTKKKRAKGQTTIHYIINSALDWTVANNMSAYLGEDSTSPTGYTTNVKFLTNAPIQKFVQRDSSEWLYFILPMNYGKSLKVKGDLYFYDGTTLTGQTLYTITTGSTNFGGVFCVAAGYNELNLESFEVSGSTTRKIRRVDFAVYQDDGINELPYTETRTYRYEIDEQPRKYGVAFLSKLGCWDIFDFSGEIIETIDRTNNEYQVPRQVVATGASPRGFQANTVFNTQVTRVIQANTSWINENHFEWLMELLASNRIYNYTETRQPYLKVREVTYQKSSNDDLFNIFVTFVETLQVNNISV